MSLEARRRDRLVVLFAAGMVLLNPPILDLIGGGRLLGLPSLFLYLLLIWAALIGAVAWIVERRARGRDAPG
jgi:hypothetical protein